MKTLIKHITLIGLGCLLTNHALAQTRSPWSIGAAIGVAQYQHMAKEDSQTALARLSFGRTLLAIEKLSAGIELGIQNGNRMRFAIPQETLDVLGGLPLTGIAKPVIDVLLTSTIPLGTRSTFVLLKGGVAYRQLQMDRASVKNLNRLSFEGQLGAGFFINDHTSLSLSWQRIAGGNPSFRVHEDTETGTVATISTQQALLLGISILL